MLQVCQTQRKRAGFGYDVTTCALEQSCKEQNDRCAESIDNQQKHAAAELKQALSPWHATAAKHGGNLPA